MDSAAYHSALAQLAWQIELGADECIADRPTDCYTLENTPAAKPGKQKTVAAPVENAPKIDPVQVAEATAAQAQDLDALKVALDGYPHCDLRKGARNLVFSDGVAGARVMIVGEAPDRDEDREGRPFVGKTGQLLDRMLTAIDLSRSQSVYITNVLPWRPPQNRDPKPEEIAMMRPFLLRHIALAKPEFLLITGNIAAHALLGKRGIARLRGQWTEAAGVPALPMFHPDHLLRNPGAKREAWADLLSLKARL